MTVTNALSGARIAGLVLAAGAGSRMGMPKALVRAATGAPWVEIAVAFLRESGCDPVFVALGARADEAAPLVPAYAEVVVVPDWESGVSAAIRAGLAAAATTDATALLITPVDTPDAAATASGRVLGAARAERSMAEALAQAVYDGRPGHPVLVGRDHWAPLAAAVTGDRGARTYLASHGAIEVECGDLWSGADVDRR